MSEFGREQGMTKHGMFKTDLSSSKSMELEEEMGQTMRVLACHARELELYPQGKEECLQFETT